MLVLGLGLPIESATGGYHVIDMLLILDLALVSLGHDECQEVVAGSLGGYV